MPGGLRTEAARAYARRRARPDACDRLYGVGLVPHVWGSGTIVAAELHAVATVLPVVSDNGFTSNAILTWTDQSRVARHYIARAVSLGILG